MSLYNQISESLSDGLMGAAQKGITSAIGSASARATEALGGGQLAKAVVGAASSATSQAARQALNKYVPYGLRAKIDAGARGVGLAMEGKFEDAAMALLDGGFADSLLAGLSGDLKNQAFRGKTSPLFGGVSLEEAKRVHDELVNAGHSRKNLFVLEVQSFAEGDMSAIFNMFAVDVDYEPFNLAADKQRVGGAVVDIVTGQEAVEMRMTMFDNTAGDLRRFFARHHAAIAARDGTVGVPADYALRIKLLHGVVAGGKLLASAYADEGLFRLTTLSNSQSRREQALQEIQLTFSQLDTFMSS